MTVVVWLCDQIRKLTKTVLTQFKSVESTEDFQLNDSKASTPNHVRRCHPKIVVIANNLFPLWQNQGFPSATSSSRLAYLDGLRGVAALMVYSIHYQGWSHNDSVADSLRLDNAFGWNGEYYIATFYGLRLLFTGGLFAVSIFFVISGYALSYGALQSVHSGDTFRLGNILSSAIFRRWFRLFIPVAATTLLWLTSWHVFRIQPSMFHQRAETYLLELDSWQRQFRTYSFFYSDKPFMLHNYHTWSIAYEFRGSIVVFTSLFALARVRHHVRLFLELVLVWYLTYIVHGWDLAHFCMGMFLCDLDLLLEDDNPPFGRLFRILTPLKTRLLSLLLIVGIYLGGVPGTGEILDNLQQNPGWYWLSFTVPSVSTDPRHFFHFIGATFVIAAIPRLSMIKKFLENKYCQYLGRVSFGLYLVHGPVLWSIGDRVYAALGRNAPHHPKLVPGWIGICRLPSWGPLGLELNFIVAQVILLPLTLCLAELTTRYIDDPSVKFAKSLWTATKEDGERRQPGVRLV